MNALLCSVLIFGFLAVYGAENCTLNMTELKLANEFNFTAFMGKWYELRWYDGDKHNDDEFALDGVSFVFGLADNFNASDPEAKAALYGRKRSPANSPCKKLNANGKSRLHHVDANNTAKMHYFVKNGLDTLFWVVSVDYAEYALVVQCETITPTGACSPNIKINVLSRKKDISSRIDKIINDRIEQELCVDPKNLTSTKLSRDCEDVINGASVVANSLTSLYVAVALLAVVKYFL